MAKRSAIPARPHDAQIVLRSMSPITIRVMTSSGVSTDIRTDMLRHSAVANTLSAFRGVEIIGQFMNPCGWWIL